MTSADPKRAFDILERTPRIVRGMLEGLDETWLHANEGPDTWSPFDIVAHYIQGEEDDWVPRFRIMLEHGEARPFEPFDRFAFIERYAGMDLDQRLRRFEELRDESLMFLRLQRLDDAQLAIRGTHPEFGPVTFGEMLATWTVHDLTHIAQMVRVMCKQNTAAVGPWSAYLPILGR